MKSECLNCGKEFSYEPSQSTGKYCSNKCQQEYQKNQTIEDWKKDFNTGVRSGFRLKKPVRDYILNKFGNKCSHCGWNEINSFTGKIPLEIDHIDGKCENNSEDNLRVLCPNCHSLTGNYKALNKGNANKGRLNYFKLI